MFEIGELKRSIFLSKEVKKILEDKSITLQEIALKMGVTHPYISQNLSGKKIPSDSFFIKVMKTIGLTESEIKKIFFEADKEEMKYKYGEDMEIIPDGKINTLENIDFENEELLKVMFKKEFGKELSDHDRDEILNFIKFKANK